jgi:uncharacterized LabA/DUF88 family protein
MSSKNQSTLEAQVTERKNFVSIYWDYENISQIENRAKSLIDFAQCRGYLVNQNVYAKASIWQQDKGKAKGALRNLDFTCVDVCPKTKNGVDFKLVIDCIGEACNNISTNLFILVTADGDYETLVCELQNRGKKVIIFYHPDKVSQGLVQIADESYPVEKLPQLVGNKAQVIDVPPQITYKDATNCLIEAIKMAVQLGKPTRYPLIDKLMRQNQQFSNYQGVSSICKPDGTTFRKFSKFVEAVKVEGKVQVRTEGKLKELFLIEKDIQVA